MTLALNEDNSHFFSMHPPEAMTRAGLDAWLDLYAGTQVSDLLFCPNSQRSSVASQARQVIWDGFDPAQDNEQPFFQGIRDKPFCMPWGARAHFRRWIEHAWLLHQQEIDPYAHWIARSRTHGIHPWISMRMNDVHYVDQPEHPIHDRFWKAHPEYRRDPEHDGYNGQCFDYGISEVRAYQLAYARELIARYDLDGFELDWMRNPYHFKPGAEAAGCAALTDFVGQVRYLLDQRAREVGHPIKLGVRVPSRPETARGLGMDALAWARRGLIDTLTITPFFGVTEFDMPIERWKEGLQDTGVVLAAGLEIAVRMYNVGAHTTAHNLETLRGAAAALLDRGADQIYLFNFMTTIPAFSKEPAGTDVRHGDIYQRALRETGTLDTMAGKSRRHVVTGPNVWAPDEAQTEPLPCACPAGGRVAFRIPIGPAPQDRQQGQVRFAVEPRETAGATAWAVEVNGISCGGAGEVTPMPDGLEPLMAFTAPAGALRRGENLIEIRNRTQTAKRLVWVELALSDSAGQWPSDGVEVTSLSPGWGRW